MKKVLFYFLVTALLILPQPLAAAPVYATGSVYTLNIGGSNMSITMPGGWVLVTKDTPADDPIFAANGINGEDFKAQLESQRIEIYAVNPETSNSIAVAYELDPSYAEEPNLSALSDSQIDGLIDGMRKGPNDEGYSFLTQKEIANLKFIYSEYKNPFDTVQYWTTVNGYSVVILLQSPEGNALNATDKDAFYLMMQSIILGGVPAAAPALPEETRSLSEETFKFSLDAASVTASMPEGWDVITRDPKVGKPIAEKYGKNWEDVLKYMKGQRIYLTAVNPSTQSQIQITLNDRGDGTPPPNFYKISPQEAQKMSAQFLQAGLPLTVPNAGGSYYICYAYAGFSDHITSISYQTRVSSTYIFIILTAAEDSVLSGEEQEIIKSVVQNVSLEENVMVEVVEGYGYVLVAALWLAFLVFALVRLINRKKPLQLRQSQYEKLGHIGGAPLIAAVRAGLGIVTGIYFLVLEKPQGTFISLYILCMLLLASVPVLLYRRFRVFPWIYAAGIILVSILNIAFLMYTWRILLIYSIDPIVLICLLASKRTAVLFRSKRIKITDPPADSPAESAAL